MLKKSKCSYAHYGMNSPSPSSTEVSGEYNVLFAYLSWEGDDVAGQCCCLVEKEFDCAFGHFNVIPEVPFGTVVASVSMVGALLVYVSMPRLRKRRQKSEN